MPLQSFTDLSPLHQRICFFLAGYRVTHPGFSPSFDEIGKQCGLGDAGVEYHLLKLQKKGWIQRLPTRHRCILPTEKLMCVTLPALAPFVSDDHFLVLPSSVSPQPTATPLVAVVIQGDAFQRDHICHGDSLLLRLQQTCRPGEVVALQHGDGSPILLKRFSHGSSGILLSSPGDGGQDVTLVSPERWERDWRVLGIVETMIRRLP